ncbi:MAG: hypothetical protein JXR70_11165 [Spirochaetales bacterium]|nr:hypothetical protein [Spirochaetales bacterium]
MIKSRWILACFLLLLIMGSLFAVSEDDLNRIFYLNSGLRELSESLENNSAANYRSDKFVIVIGSVASLFPQKNSAYLITEDDLIDPIGFVKSFKNPSSAFTKKVAEQFSSRLKTSMEQSDVNNQTITALLRDLLRDFSRIMRREIFYQPGLEKQVPLSEELLQLIAKTTDGDEMGFINRLIFEAVFPKNIKKFEISLNLQDGEWLDFDKVKTYQLDVLFDGVECFKIFNRREPTKASEEYVPLNSKAMIIASLIKPIQKEDGLVWQAKGYYIRRIP